MSLAKLKKRYKSEVSNSAALRKAKQLREQAIALPPAPFSELLDLPFAEWCESLKIKTPEGLAPFELFDWQRETAKLIIGDARANGRRLLC